MHKLLEKLQLVESYQYSSTQFDIPEPVRGNMLMFGKQIADGGVYPEEGREDHPHITIKYGLHTRNFLEVADKVRGFGPVTVKLGKLFKFESNDYDVLLISIESERLHELNKLVSGLDNTNNYPEYKPHATIAYLNKGEADKYLDDDRFEGIEITFDSLMFSKGGDEEEYSVVWL